MRVLGIMVCTLLTLFVIGETDISIGDKKYRFLGIEPRIKRFFTK